MSGSQTLLICIGAQKAATSWLHAQFASHADVYAAFPKELHYWNYKFPPFNTSARTGANQRVGLSMDPSVKQVLRRKFVKAERERHQMAGRLRAIYDTDLFDHSAYLAYAGIGTQSASTVLDFTPAYALLSAADLAKMADCHSDVRVIYVMRDPVLRFWSGIKQRYRMQISLGVMTEASVAEIALEALDRLDHPDMQRTDYPSVIDHVTKAVPAGKYHFAFAEDILSDGPEGKTARAELEAFSGVGNVAWDAQSVVYGSSSAISKTAPDRIEAAAIRRFGPMVGEIEQRLGRRVPDVWQTKQMTKVLDESAVHVS